MRIELLEPVDLTPEVVADTLHLVCRCVSLDVIRHWTRLELALAYDWAIREHLHAAGNLIRRRDRPSFTIPAAV